MRKVSYAELLESFIEAGKNLPRAMAGKDDAIEPMEGAKSSDEIPEVA